MSLHPRWVLQWLRQRVAPSASSPSEGERYGQAPHQDHEDQRRDVETALRELHAAEQYFQNVSDPELIDHAIYSWEAARRKLMYLLKYQRRPQNRIPG